MTNYRLLLEEEQCRRRCV